MAVLTQTKQEFSDAKQVVRKDQHVADDIVIAGSQNPVMFRTTVGERVRRNVDVKVGYVLSTEFQGFTAANTEIRAKQWVLKL